MHSYVFSKLNNITLCYPSWKWKEVQRVSNKCSLNIKNNSKQQHNSVSLYSYYSISIVLCWLVIVSPGWSSWVLAVGTESWLVIMSTDVGTEGWLVIMCTGRGYWGLACHYEYWRGYWELACHYEYWRGYWELACHYEYWPWALRAGLSSWVVVR